MVAVDIKAPTIEQCFELFERYSMLDNIKAHSLVVTQVAKAILDSLKEAGKAPQPIADKELVLSGALLHDIAKTECLQTPNSHAKRGREICRELGFSELGEIIAEHVLLKEFKEDLYCQGHFSPKEIVYYSDKRVRHDQIVTLQDRLQYILDRYGRDDPTREKRIRHNFQKTTQLENYLFSYMNFKPEELIHKINSEFLTKAQQ